MENANADMLGINATLVLDVWLVANALEVTAVNLYARLVGKHLHKDACLGRVKACTNLCVVAFAILVGVQTPVVIETMCILNLVEL